MAEGTATASPLPADLRGADGWLGRYRDAHARLRAHQKPARGVAPYSLYVNRPFGRRLAAVAFASGWTPNAVTVLSSLTTTAALVLLATARPTPVTGVLVAVLALLAYGLDSADGQLARLRRTGGSAVGELLDHLLDAAKVAGFHVAVLVSAVRFDADLGLWPVVTAAIFTVVATASFFGLWLMDQLRRGAGTTPPDRPTTWRFRLAATPTDYGVMCLWLAFRPASDVFFLGYALLALSNAAHLVVATRSRFREAAAIDRARGATS